MTSETLAATEKWFRRRGIPHFIEDYSTRRDVLTKALPFLILTAVFEVAMVFNLEWAWWINVPFVAGACAALGCDLGGNQLPPGAPAARAARASRRRGLIVFLLAPSVVAAVFERAWEVLPFLLVVNGADPGNRVCDGELRPAADPALGGGARDSQRRPASWIVRAGAAAAAADRDVPLHQRRAVEHGGNARRRAFWLVVWLFASVTAVFVVFRLPAEIGEIQRFASATQVTELVRGTPVEGLTLPSARCAWTRHCAGASGRMPASSCSSTCRCRCSSPACSWEDSS